MNQAASRKYLAGKKTLPSPNYSLEDSWEDHKNDFESPEKFLEHVVSEMNKCSNDILHFAENYFYIVNVDEGRKPIELYDCQKTVLLNLVNNRFNVVAASRQVGKTTVTTIYVLWQALFKKDQNIFVLANKEETAKMILERIRMAYEEIPNWLKSPAIDFSKTAIKLSNGSKISTSTTSEQGIRGQSANCIVLDEFAFVRPEIAYKFYEAVWPTISSSRTAKIIMLSTPNGTSNIFYDMYSRAELGEGNKEWNGWKASKIMWDEIPRFNEKGELDYEGFKKSQIAGFSGNIDSWLQEFCCVFLDKGAASLSLTVLQDMKKAVRPPLYSFEEGDYLVWEDRQPGHIYVIGVDTSEGIGLDYSVAQVIDITDLTDIRLVAQYHSNLLQPYVFAEKLNRVARGWGKPFLAIERNSPGGQVVDAMKEIHQYDRIIQYTMKNDKKGMNQKLGIFCHQNSKYTGIMNTKYWMETLRAVTIPDANTIKEFETFRRKENGTWKAKDGHFDDRVMSLVWALIILETEITQKYLSILQYDDVGKPKIIRDDFGEYIEEYGPLWDDSPIQTSYGSGPQFIGFNEISSKFNDLYSLGDDGRLGVEIPGWTIL